MRITRLPYNTPKEASRTSAILIARGLIAIVITWYLPNVLRPKFIPFMVFFLIYGVFLIGGTTMVLSGTVMGLRAIYNLKRAGEKLGFAWVTIIALPLTLFLILFIILSIGYNGP